MGTVFWTIVIVLGTLFYCYLVIKSHITNHKQAAIIKEQNGRLTEQETLIQSLRGGKSTDEEFNELYTKLRPYIGKDCIIYSVWGIFLVKPTIIVRKDNEYEVRGGSKDWIITIPAGRVNDVSIEPYLNEQGAWL